MADIEHSVVVNNNLVEVFKTVTAYDDESTLMQWQPNLKSVGVTAGNPLRTGSMIGMRKQFIMSEIFVNFDVTDLQRNKRFDIKGMHGRFPITREIEFSPNGRETQIKDRIWIRTGALFFWWRPFVMSALKRQTATEWALLKQMLEK